MAKVISPQGEKIIVRRRWFPWPRFTSIHQLKNLGVPAGIASILSKGSTGDWAALGLVVFLYFIVFVISFNFFVVSLALGVIFLFVRFLSIAWHIEVIYEKNLIESDQSEGFSATSNRIAKIAALYESGSLRPPNKPKQKARQLKAYVPVEDEAPPVKPSVLPVPPHEPTLPIPAPALPEIELEIIPEPEPEPEHEPEVEYVPPVPAPRAQENQVKFTGESALRRAIRAVEEEEAKLAAAGSLSSQTDSKTVKRAKVKPNSKKK